MMKTKKELMQERNALVAKGRKQIEKVQLFLEDHCDDWTSILEEIYRELLSDAAHTMTKAAVITEILEG